MISAPEAIPTAQASAGAARRPIAARAWPVFARMAEWLVRRHASPNAISLAGMVSAILAGFAFAAVHGWPAAARPLWVVGAVLVELRLLANMLDGMVAVGRGVASPIGELVNDVPDRLSDTAVLLGVGIAAGGVSELGGLALGLGAALAAMSTAYVRLAGVAAGAPADFCGPMAKPHRMHVVTALALWCAVAPERIGTASMLPVVVIAAIILLALVTAARRLGRTVRVLRGRAQ